MRLAAELPAGKTTTVASFDRQAAGAQALPRRICRASGSSPGAAVLPVLRRQAAAQAGRGHHRDAGSDPAPVEGDPDVREKFSCRACEKITQPPAPFHLDRQRAGRRRPAGDDPLREVRQSPAVEPAERALRPRGHAISACRRWPIGSAAAPQRWRLWSSASRPMCWAPRAFMATIRQCRCWPR